MREKGTKASMEKVIAVDFDGVLFTDFTEWLAQALRPEIEAGKVVVMI